MYVSLFVFTFSLFNQFLQFLNQIILIFSLNVRVLNYCKKLQCSMVKIRVLLGKNSLPNCTKSGKRTDESSEGLYVCVCLKLRCQT